MPRDASEGKGMVGWLVGGLRIRDQTNSSFWCDATAGQENNNNERHEKGPGSGYA